MWEIPLTAIIGMMAVLIYKRMDIEANRQDERNADLKSLYRRLNELVEEFAEYKKRVDVLGLKAGFKI